MPATWAPPEATDTQESWQPPEAWSPPEATDVAKGERPPGALPVAGFVDSLAAKLAGAFGSKDFENGAQPITDLVKAGTRKPRPGETSFTNLGIPDVFGPQTSVAGQIGGAVANFPGRTANFVLSPAGAAFPSAIGLLPKLGRILVGGGFAAQQGVAAYQAPTLQEKLGAIANTALIGAGTGLDILGGEKPEAPSQIPSALPTDVPSVSPTKEVLPAPTEAGQTQVNLSPAVDVAQAPPLESEKAAGIEAAKPETPTPQGRTPTETGVSPGFVRLYHGGSGDQAGSDFTTSRSYAQGYADKTPEGKLWYVDIPEGSLKTHDETGQPMSRVIVPNEIADQAKPVATASEAQPQIQEPIAANTGSESPPQVPENKQVTINATTPKGEPLEVKMDAKEASDMLEKRRTSLENLLDCLGK